MRELPQPRKLLCLAEELGVGRVPLVHSTDTPPRKLNEEEKATSKRTSANWRVLSLFDDAPYSLLCRARLIQHNSRRKENCRVPRGQPKVANHPADP